MSAYIVDTECTDLDDPEVIELAWIKLGSASDFPHVLDAIPYPLLETLEVFEQRYAPSKPSSLGALSVHHILPEELEGCPPSSEARLPENCEYLIAHNADHDWRCLGAPPNVKRICTDAMARYVWPDLDSYKQSALLYHVLGATPYTRERLRNAHSAMTDAENLATILANIIRAAPVKLETWSELHEYSEACRIPRVLPFGKHKGMPLDELVDFDPGYVDWMLRQHWLDPYLRKGLELALKPPPENEPDDTLALIDDDLAF